MCRMEKAAIQLEADKWCDGATAARLLGISRTHIYKLVGRGTITPYKIGALTVFWRTDLHNAIAARETWQGADRAAV